MIDRVLPFVLLCVFALGTQALSSCESVTDASVSPGSGAQASPATCSACSAALDAEGWCPRCGVGFAKGLETRCRSCLAAIHEDGWCEGCQVGYVDGQKTKCSSCFAAMSSAAGGWCPDCGVGYSAGLKTKCRSCFDAIAVNGTCEDCGVRFQDGRSFQSVVLHVHGMDSDVVAARVQEVLREQEGLGSIRVDAGSGTASFELETTRGATSDAVVAALASAGYSAHPGGH